MNVNAKKTTAGVYTDLGSDGNNSVNSLISDERTIRIQNRKSSNNRTSWINHQIDNTMYEEQIRHNATKRPDMIQWKPNPKKITIHKRGSMIGIEFNVKPIKNACGSTLLYLIVQDVKEGSPAALANLKRGDLILSVNGHPTHYDESHRERTQAFAVDDIENIIRESARKETMVLIVQSPSDMKKDENDNSYQGFSSIYCRANIMLQPADNHRPSRNSDTFSQTAIIHKLPYSKLILLGEQSTLLAKHLFGEDIFLTRDRSFHNEAGIQRGSLNLQESQTLEPVITFRKCLRTYKSWLQDVVLHRESSNQNGKNLSSMFLDVITVSQTDALTREVLASFFMSGNEVYVYQMSAIRLQEESELCLNELQSALNKIKSLAGHRVPVIIAVISKDTYLDARCQDYIVTLLGRFASDPQIVLFPNNSPCCFLSVHDGSENSSDSEFDSLLSSVNDMSQQSVEEVCCTSNLLKRLLLLVWEQKFMPTCSPTFFKSIDSFWRMVDIRKGHECFLKRDIQAVLHTKAEADVNDFVHFLTLQSELLPAYPGSVQQLLISPLFLIPPFLKLLKGPPAERDSLFLRNHWKRLSTIGIASLKLLKGIFHEFDLHSVLSSLCEFRLTWRLSHIAIETNADLKRMFSSRDKLYFFPLAQKPANDCKCSNVAHMHQLIIRFEETLPPGFVEDTVFGLIEKLKDRPVRWKTCHRGCFEVIVGDDCVALFKEDVTTASIRIYCSFTGRYRPKKFLQTVRKTIEDTDVVGVDMPVLGCECPLTETCQGNPDGQNHLIDLDIDFHEPFPTCGNQSLKEHPAIRLWLLDSNIDPMVLYSKPSESVLVTFHHGQETENINGYSTADNPDDLSNLNHTIYEWLCNKLNVLDTTHHLDWRMVAYELGYNRDDIEQFNRPGFFSDGSVQQMEWNPCKKLFQAWMSSRKSSISGLMSLLRKVGREDIAYDMARKLEGTK